MTQLKIAVGFPAYGGQIAAEHARMWMSLGATLADSRERFGLVSFGYVDMNPVDRARNFLLHAAERVGADWLLSIDADTWAVDSADDDSAGVQLLRMISDADRAGATLVSAPYVARTTGESTERKLVVYSVERDGGDLAHMPLLKSQIPRRLLEVDAVGAGCFAINMHRVKEYGLRYGFEPALSEDLDMCRQIRDSREALRDDEASDISERPELRGTSIYVDGRVHTAHLSRPFPLLTSAL